MFLIRVWAVSSRDLQSCVRFPSQLPDNNMVRHIGVQLRNIIVLQDIRSISEGPYWCFFPSHKHLQGRAGCKPCSLVFFTADVLLFHSAPPPSEERRSTAELHWCQESWWVGSLTLQSQITFMTITLLSVILGREPELRWPEATQTSKVVGVSWDLRLF